MQSIKEYAFETAKEYATGANSQEYKEKGTRRTKMPTTYHSVNEVPHQYSYDRPEVVVIEKPVVYEYVGKEVINPNHHHHYADPPHQHFDYVPEAEKRVQYVEYDRVSEYDRDGKRDVQEADVYMKQKYNNNYDRSGEPMYRAY